MHNIRVAIALLIFSAGLWAQGTTSRLLGVVQDPTGAAVPGASVQLIQQTTKATFSAKTASNGAYAFEALQSGPYTVAVEAAGFRKFLSKDNVVAIGQPTTVNVTLEVGQLSEQIEVAATAEAVQTSSSGNFGNLFTDRAVMDLPIVGTRGRNPLALVLLQPGVVNSDMTGGGINVHGARDRAWNYTLDGIDVNETSSGGSNTTPLKSNPDSIAEFRVLTSNATAEFGRNSGGQVAMITRSGGNELHGTGFWFYRTPSLNANEWENNLNKVGKRQFVQQIFGGSIGGPVIKNKTFFFANLQVLRALQTRTVDRTVYTADARKGLLRYVKGGRNRPAGLKDSSVDASGNVIPGLAIGTYSVPGNDPQRLGLDPTIQGLIGQSPLPNNFTGGDGLNTAFYTFTAAEQERQHDQTVKIDHIFNPKNTVYARIAWGSQDTNCDRVNGGQEIFPGTGCMVNTIREPRNLAFNWRWNPKPTVTNELVVGENQFNYDFQQPSSLAKISLNGPVDTTAQYYFGNKRALKTWQVVDNLAWFRGAHALKFGTNLRFQQHVDARGSVGGLNANQDANFSTSINTVDPATFGLPADLNTTYDRPAVQGHINFLLGRIGRTTRGFISQGDQFVPGLFRMTSHYGEYDFFVQDTWKVNKRLTVDLGLRLEMKLAPTSDEAGRVRRPDQLVTAGAAPSNTLRWRPGSLYNDSLNNLSPSIGVAWDPTGSGRTSIRANYRMAYDRIATFLLSSQVFSNSPGVSLGVTNEEFGQGGGRLAQLKPLAPPTVKPNDLAQPIPFSNNSVTVVDPSFKMPTTHQWALSLQREVLRKTVLEVSYIGRRAYHLLGAYNANQASIFRNGFLDAFKTVKAGGESALMNQLLAADSRLRPGETGSQMVRRLESPTLNLNSVASLASSIATRLQGGRSVTDLSGAGPFAIIPYPQFGGGMTVIDSNDFSTYHGLEVQLERRLGGGLTAQISYTLSKSLDTRSFDPTFSVVSTGSSQGAGSTPIDIYNRRLNYAPSEYDRTHVVQSNWMYELPFGKGKRFGGQLSGLLDRVVGGWEVSGFVTIYGGRPMTVFSGSNTVSQVRQTPAVCNGCSRSLGRVFDDPANGYKFYFNDAERAKFSAPGPGEFGNTGRTYFRGPGSFDLDMALLKHVPVTERVKMELRADVTNLTNTPTFGFPTLTLTSTTFGRIRDSVSSASRKIQIGAKITF